MYNINVKSKTQCDWCKQAFKSSELTSSSWLGKFYNLMPEEDNLALCADCYRKLMKRLGER